jgi:ATP-binding cassette subfamily B (MDR/TAP) protein 1
MDGGIVLERGKHDELLSNEGGPYARLVAAQRLREAHDEIDIGDVVPVEQKSCEKAVESSVDIEKAAAMEEVHLGRRSTSRSLAGEIIEQRKAQGLSNQEKEYSMFYLFKRMGRINRGEWKHYLFGFLFSIGKYFPFLGQSWPLTIGLQLLVLSSRLSVLFGVRKTWAAFSAWAGANYSAPQTAQAVTSFSDPPRERRHAGDRNALW